MRSKDRTATARGKNKQTIFSILYGVVQTNPDLGEVKDPRLTPADPTHTPFTPPPPHHPSLPVFPSDVC